MVQACVLQCDKTGVLFLDNALEMIASGLSHQAMMIESQLLSEINSVILGLKKEGAKISTLNYVAKESLANFGIINFKGTVSVL